MTLRHLQIFESVCAHMSITQAADALNMTQPAVSIAIKELEAFYNTKLFDRIGRKIYLTETGEKLRNYTDTIIEQFDVSVSDIRDKSNLVTCRIGVNVTVGEGYLSAIIRTLKEHLPELKLYITVDNTNAIESKLARNEMDFALTDTPADTHSLNVTRLHGEKMQIVCSPSFTAKSEVSVSELSEMPLLLREKGSGCRNCIDAVFDRAGYFPIPIAQSVSNLALIELAKCNMGVTILPISLVDSEIQSGALKCLTLSDGEFVRDYYLVYHIKKFLSPAVADCIELLKGFSRYTVSSNEQ